MVESVLSILNSVKSAFSQDVRVLVSCFQELVKLQGLGYATLYQ